MMTTVRTMDARPTATRVTSVADALFEKHAKKGTALARIGLDKDDVARLTRTMRREAWFPTKWGVSAMTEFLDAGFKDMTKNDYRKWGVTNAQAAGWARRNKSKLSKHKVGAVEDGKTDTATVYNWK